MFTKNNLKYVLILAIGFFWCSSVYLTQEQYLTNYANVKFVNIVELLFGSLSMALGILIFGLLYRKNRNIRNVYTIFILLSIISMILFFVTKNIYVMSICLCLTCLFGTAGFGAGYHFSLLGLNVDKEYRGRVFSIGYGLGSIGTYLLTMFPESFYASIVSLVLYIPIVLLNLYFVLTKSHLQEMQEEKFTSSFKNYFIRISIIVLAMSLLSALSTDIIGLYTINVSSGFGSTRLYYCLGLLIAGFLVDKKNNVFEILTIASLVFSLLSIILLKENYPINFIAGLSYSFVAFFVLFRTMIFINLVDNKKSIIWTSAFGLMYSRVIEGLMVLFEDRLIEHYTVLIIIMTITLSLVIVLHFLLYFEHKGITENDAVKQMVVKYKLSSQEEKVLNLLIQGKTNQEMADELFLSVYTIKRHVSGVYQKTGMKKKELKEKCYIRT